MGDSVSSWCLQLLKVEVTADLLLWGLCPALLCAGMETW